MLAVHSYFRWLILILFVVVLTKHCIAWQRHKIYAKQDKILDLVLVSSLDLMLLIGIYLFFTSPYGGMAVYKIEGWMRDAPLRKTALEHPIMALLSIVFAHIASAQKKKNIPDELKHKRIFIFFIISLALLLLAIPKW